MARKERLIFAAVFLAGLLVRLPFLPVDFNATADVPIFMNWVRLANERGLVNIYSGHDVIYPPLLLYWFAGAGAIERQLPSTLRNGDRALIAFIKFPALVADVLTAVLIAWGLGRQPAAVRILACAIYLFHPAIWYVSAFWGQTDAVYTLFLLCSILALARGVVAPTWVLYGLAVATKLQSISLAPLLVSATLFRYGARRLVTGVFAMAMTNAIVAAPWLLSGHGTELVSAATRLALTPRHVGVSAYNLWYLLLMTRVATHSSADYPLGLPFSYRQIAIVLFGLVSVIVAARVWRWPQGSLALTAALLGLGMFVLLTDMHERYMFPAIAFILLAAAQTPGPAADEEASLRLSRPRELWWIFAVLSITFFYNLASIASFYPPWWTHVIAAPPMTPLIIILKALSLVAAAVNMIVLGWLIWRVAREPVGQPAKP